MEKAEVIELEVDSIEVVENEDVYDITVDGNHNFFANGILVHNCEISLENKGLCNLTEVAIRHNDTLESLQKKVRLAAVLGTVQATLTDFNFVSKQWKINAEKDRLLGVSLTGTADHPIFKGDSKKNITLMKQWLTELKSGAKSSNIKWAKLLGINEADGVTTIKPSGTTSQLLSTSSGVHARWSKFYIRRVRVSANDPIAKLMIFQGMPWEPENNQDRENCSTIVFSFPQKSPEGAITRHDFSAIEQCERALLFKKYYCDHNVSATIYVKENEWISVGAWVYENWDDIVGLSFLPADDGVVYAQMPYEEITEEQYNKMVASMPNIDYSVLGEFERGDMTTGSTALGCEGNACELNEFKNSQKE